MSFESRVNEWFEEMFEEIKQSERRLCLNIQREVLKELLASGEKTLAELPTDEQDLLKQGVEYVMSRNP